MKQFYARIAALGAAALMTTNVFAGHGHGWGRGGSPCETTAREMYKACGFDVRDDLNVAQARCTNISDSGDRRACRDEARAAFREDAALCSDQFAARVDACETLGEERYDPDPLAAPGSVFVDPNDVDQSTANPYVSIVAGHTYVLRAGEEEEEIVVVHVTGETREIQGAECRVIVDAVVVTEEDETSGEIDYVPVEITDDWMAQDQNGDVYYCGEIARNFEDGQLVDLDGSFEAGRGGAKAGIQFKSMPEPGIAHRQEFALGEAEDIIRYEDVNASPIQENAAFPCGDGCVKTFDFTPLSPESTEFKYYRPGVGFVLAEAMEDGKLTGEREELVCVGSSLEVLRSGACDILDPELLLEKLCELSPQAFCPSGE
ncbi:hypothetical protein [Thiosocius teredinicola]|uniref:hypothetical protein n=1 Tax=Thiosocius teredinicola TaxID=1973002 RepID=UPI000990C8FF